MTPLVLVVAGATPAARAAEAVLAKLRFGVAMSDSVDEALGLIPTLRPEIVVVPAEDVLRLRTLPPDHPRVVVMRDDPDLMVEAIRRSLA